MSIHITQIIPIWVRLLMIQSTCWIKVKNLLKFWTRLNLSWVKDNLQIWKKSWLGLLYQKQIKVQVQNVVINDVVHVHIFMNVKLSFSKNQKTFQIRHPMNCKSKNLIYVITCNGCGEHYIGLTGDKLCTRMTVHRQQIRDPSTRQLPVSDHLETCNRNPSKLQFMVAPILKINSDDKAKRIAAENWLINLFNPKLNK